MLTAAPAQAAPPSIIGPGGWRDRHPDPDPELAAAPRAPRSTTSRSPRRTPSRPSWSTSRPSTASTRRSCSCPPARCYWRVRATGSGDPGWANAQFVRGTLDAPTMLGPTGALPQPDSPPLISWTPVQGALQYNLQVSTDPDFIDPTKIVTYTPTKTTSGINPVLAVPAVYYARVRATFAAGIVERLLRAHLVHDPGPGGRDPAEPSARRSGHRRGPGLESGPGRRDLPAPDRRRQRLRLAGRRPGQDHRHPVLAPEDDRQRLLLLASPPGGRVRQRPCVDRRRQVDLPARLARPGPPRVPRRQRDRRRPLLLPVEPERTHVERPGGPRALQQLHPRGEPLADVPEQRPALQHREHHLDPPERDEPVLAGGVRHVLLACHRARRLQQRRPSGHRPDQRRGAGVHLPPGRAEPDLAGRGPGHRDRPARDGPDADVGARSDRVPLQGHHHLRRRGFPHRSHGRHVVHADREAPAGLVLLAGSDLQHRRPAGHLVRLRHRIVHRGPAACRDQREPGPGQLTLRTALPHPEVAAGPRGGLLPALGQAFGQRRRTRRSTASSRTRPASPPTATTWIRGPTTGSSRRSTTTTA